MMRTAVVVGLACLALLAGCNKEEEQVTLETEPAIQAPARNNDGGMAVWQDVPMEGSTSWPSGDSMGTTPETIGSPAPIPVPPRAQPRTHVVVKGDTMWSLAEKYLGSGRRWQEIADANPGVDINKLSIGTKLTIPPR